MEFTIIQFDPLGMPCKEMSESMAKWEWALSKCKHWWWAAYPSDADIWTAWVGYSGLSFYDNETAMLGPAFVKEFYRGRGLQRRMYAPKEAFARERGFKTILACTDLWNIHSSNNLMALGFKMRKPWPEAELESGRRKAGAIFWEKSLCQ
jgi:GNAT superfamily N-acetyltransferase